MYTIHEITDVKELKRFADYPNKIYEDDPYYVPGLLSDDINTFSWEKNPAYQYCEAKFWFAMDGTTIVGRICAIINHRYIEKWGHKYGRFGFIDFVERYEVAELLLDTACEWLKSKGMEGVQGPLGFCDLDPEGMLVDGFNERSTLVTIYNKPYYPKFIEQYGFTKDVDWFEYKMPVGKEFPKILNDIADRCLERTDLKVYKAKSMKELRSRYGEKIFELLNETYSDLYGVVELNDEQIQCFIKQYMGLLSYKYVRLIVNSKDELIAFGIGMPNLDDIMQKCRGRLTPVSAVKLLYQMRRRYPKVIDLLLIATRADYQKHGVNALLLREVFDFAFEHKIEYFNLCPELETNIKVTHGFKYFNVIHNKTRRSYIKLFNESEKTNESTEQA